MVDTACGAAARNSLGIKQQPRDLLRGVEGLTLRELPDAEVCCGFGGTFCVKYPEISTRMVSDKAANIRATGADTVLAGIADTVPPIGEGRG